MTIKDCIIVGLIWGAFGFSFGYVAFSIVGSDWFNPYVVGMGLTIAMFFSVIWTIGTYFKAKRWQRKFGLIITDWRDSATSRATCMRCGTRVKFGDFEKVEAHCEGGGDD